MAYSLDTLLKNDDISRLTSEIEKLKTPSGGEKREEDTRFWKIERDKSGNGSAVIRFLPAPKIDGDTGLPWAIFWDHGFKGPTGKWYIEKSLTSLEQKDPVSDYNRILWGDSSITDDSYRSVERKQARNQKRRLHYISNILVVSDPKHPENEGKVFLFKYGKKIFDKIQLSMKPEFAEDKPVNPFHFMNGANFKLRIRTVEGYPNYDQSSFESPSPVSGGKEAWDNLWAQSYSLKEFLDPKGFKSYDELKTKLDAVMGFNTAGQTSVSVAPSSSRTETVQSKDVFKAASSRKSIPDDDDPELAEFKALADL